MAAPRFLANIAGRIKMIVTIATSAGAADAEKVPSTNSSGVLDPTIINAATTGADKVIMTKPDGTLDTSVMPPGIVADTQSITASEVLSAGNFVNVWNDAGVVKVRKADATAEGKEAHGFVLAGAASGAAATVYFESKNTQLSGMTLGARQYLATTPGARTETAPSAAGNVVQVLGVAYAATGLNFEPQEPITVA